MTREEAKEFLIDMSYKLGNMSIEYLTEKAGEKMREAIKILEQEPCDKCVYSTKDGYCQYDDITETIPPFEPYEDAISRQAVKEQMIKYGFHAPDMTVTEFVEDLPPAIPQPKTGHCKECKYFEYDSVAKVDGIPLIVAHEICSKWGDGCKTSEDGYCFLFEQLESEESNADSD